MLRPGTVEQVVIPGSGPGLAEGEVRLRLLAAGLCGSDMPRFKGTRSPSQEGGFAGAPVHEVVGEVVETASPELAVGQKAVGTLGREGGLAEFVVAAAAKFVSVPDGLGDVEAVTIQSLATVLRAVAKFPSTARSRVAVLGAGPIGLAFCHVLRKRGAAYICAVDPVDKAQLAKAFGADEFCCKSSTDWLRSLGEDDRPQIVVEAVGHQQVPLRDAVHAVDEHGFVFGFGEPDDADYTLPYEQLYMKDVTLASGRTIDEWPQVLAAAREYLLRHREDFVGYISHVVPVQDAQRAYSLYARPQPGRAKVVIVP